MTIGFIGIGRIAGALIRGLCTSDIKNININLSPRNERISSDLSETFPTVTRQQSNQQVLDTSDIIFISIPPPGTKKILADLTFRGNQTVISVIPYLLYEDLLQITSPAAHVSRAIPLPTVADHHCPIPVFNANGTVTELFQHLGEPLTVTDEDQLHALWVLTGLISPYFDFMDELSRWSQDRGVAREVADRYIVDMFSSLTCSAGNTDPIDFGALTRHAATPNGMNEQAARELNEKKAHQAYTITADNLLKRFPDTV